MAEDRKVRIAALEEETKKLKDEEHAENVKRLAVRVNIALEGLHYDDVVLVEKLVQERRSRLWTLEGDDDE